MTIGDVMAMAGYILLATGLAAYDWRLATIVAGAILLIIGLYAAARGR